MKRSDSFNFESNLLSTFESMELFDPIKRAISEQNYTTPTPIQQQTIPAAIDGKDILGCAQTGTGKTAAFALPMLDFVGREQPKLLPTCPATLVLAPTRELAIQISDSFDVYGKHMRFRKSLVFGGVSQKRQVSELKRGVDVLVATPGRLLDLMQQRHVSLKQIQIFVLDEADRMMDMGFLPDLKRIISKLPENRQSLFFSATMPPESVKLSNQLLFNPVTINVTPKSPSVKKIKQKVMMLDRGEKFTFLKELLHSDEAERTIVFTRTKRGANTIAKKLATVGVRSAAIHGNKSQNARQRALDAFRRKRISVLVATDVAARGIDIDGISHVVNYDMPVEPESYVHRIGRTGRAGAEGIAISLCAHDERRELRAIEKLVGERLDSDHSSRSHDSHPSKSNASQERTRSGKRRPNQSRKRPSGKASAGKNSSGKNASGKSSGNGATSQSSFGKGISGNGGSGKGSSGKSGSGKSSFKGNKNRRRNKSRSRKLAKTSA